MNPIIHRALKRARITDLHRQARRDAGPGLRARYTAHSTDIPCADCQS